MIVVVGMGMLLGGCAAGLGEGRADLPKTYPATVEDWHGSTVDHVEFLKPYKLNSYQSVAIMPLDTAGARIPNDNTGDAVERALKNVTATYSAGVSETLKGFTVQTVAAGATPTAGALVLRGRVVEISPGSQAARHFVGFGAGASRTRIEGELFDPATNSVLIKFVHAKASGTGTFGGDYDSLIKSDIKDVGKDIGTLIGASYEVTK